MSQRIYSGPRADRGSAPTGWLPFLPWGLAAVTILGQILWVLTHGNLRAALTLLTVLTFFGATVTHAYLRRGLAWTAGYTGITLAFGLFIEALGVRTQFPFGHYWYSQTLGMSVLHVPLIIPLAWSMMAYPCLLAAQRLTESRMGTTVVGGVLLASWDLFLDPQMTGEGYWHWAPSKWQLPGVAGVPLQNFLGWLLAAVALMALLSRLPRKIARDGVPTLLLAWVYTSSTLAALVFFHRPGVALWGGICMGTVIIPWAWRVWSQPQW